MTIFFIRVDSKIDTKFEIGQDREVKGSKVAQKGWSR